MAVSTYPWRWRLLVSKAIALLANPSDLAAALSAKFRASLRFKVAMLVLCASTVALLTSAAALTFYELRRDRQGWMDELRTQAEIAAHVASPFLASGDTQAAGEAVSSLLRLWPHVKGAAVYHDAEVVARYAPARSGELHAGGQRVDLIHPIRHHGAFVGALHLRADYDGAARMGEWGIVVLGITLTSLLVAMLATARPRRALTRPIRSLVDAVRRREASSCVARATDDEVGVLADTFDDMLSELAHRDAALQRAKARLSKETDERLKARQALDEAANAKNQFLATLAHELRNPLAPIGNAVEILRRATGSADTAVRTRALDIINRQLRQMVRLIDDLLDVSRIATGKPLLHKSRIDLRAVLHNAIETTGPLLETRRHQLTLDLPDQPVWVHGDATRLAQVFSNLLDNAAKYTDLCGTVHVSLVPQDDGGAVVRVADSGAGIAPEMQPRIFDMFVQLDQTVERGKAGLGVGLALARQFVELHGGHVGVHSAGRGLGSTFEVWLPRDGSVEEPVPRLPSQRMAAPHGSHRILVVDDNVDFASSLANIFQSLGHAVTVTYDGLSALHIAADTRPDFVFLDIGMPGLNGYELAERLRHLPATRDCVIVAISGWGSDKDRLRPSRFDHHLVKPVDMSELLPILEAGRTRSASVANG